MRAWLDRDVGFVSRLLVRAAEQRAVVQEVRPLPHGRVHAARSSRAGLVRRPLGGARTAAGGTASPALSAGAPPGRLRYAGVPCPARIGPPLRLAPRAALAPCPSACPTMKSHGRTAIPLTSPSPNNYRRLGLAVKSGRPAAVRLLTLVTVPPDDSPHEAAC